MVEQNYQYLIEALAKLGFSDVLNDELQRRMNIGTKQFEIKAQTSTNSEKVLYALKFEKKDDDLYFLNTVKGSLTKENQQPVTHDFFLYKQKGYNVQEMKNMLEGRAVYKMFRREGQDVGRWTRIDFNVKDERGNNQVRSYYDNQTNFNLVAELSKLPVVNMSQEEKEGLIRSLRNGELANVTVRQNGNRERMYIEATPHMGALVLYNTNMEKVSLNNNRIQVLKEEKAEQKLPDTTKRIIEAQENEQTKQQQPKRRVG